MTPADRLLEMARSGDPAIALAQALARAAAAGDLAARLRVRREIEAAFGDGDVLPEAADYVRAARTLRAEGRAGMAEVFGRSAMVQSALNAAEARWRERYGTEPAGPAARELRYGGRVFRLGPALRGIDGALYQTGQAGRADAVVVAAGAGDRQIVLGGWDTLNAAQSFVRGRLASGDGPLDWPACAAASVLAREEQALAFVLRAPWELDRSAAALRNRSWTAAARGEIFAAALATCWRGHPVTAATVTAEALDRYAWAPAWAHAGDLERYVRRLAITEVSQAQALDAIAALTGQRQARGARPSPAPAPECPALLASPPPPQVRGPLPRL